MDNQSLIEKLLKEKKELTEIIEKQEEIIQRLDAYKRTIVKSIAGIKPSLDLPIKFKNNQKLGIQKIEDGLFLLGIEKPEIENSDRPVESLRTLRYFRKCANNMKTGENTWYTTTVLNKNGKQYFIIKDDENNQWKGHDVFDLFAASFDFQLPFSSIEEWLGLKNQKMEMLLKSLN